MKSPDTVVDSSNPQDEPFLSDGITGDDGKIWISPNPAAIQAKLGNLSQVMAVEVLEIHGARETRVILLDDGRQVVQAEADTTSEGVSNRLSLRRN